MGKETTVGMKMSHLLIVFIFYTLVSPSFSPLELWIFLQPSPSLCVKGQVFDKSVEEADRLNPLIFIHTNTGLKTPPGRSSTRALFD